MANPPWRNLYPFGDRRAAMVANANLRSPGQINTEYTDVYNGFLPPGWDYLSGPSCEGWRTQLFCLYTGESLQQFYNQASSSTNHPKGLNTGLREKWLALARCPASALPADGIDPSVWNVQDSNIYYTDYLLPSDYSANPNFFLLYVTTATGPHAPGFGLSNVQNPSQSVAFGDGNEDQKTSSGMLGSWLYFDWYQNSADGSPYVAPYENDPGYLVPPDGFTAGMVGNVDQSGPSVANSFRYRHDSSSPNSGTGNAVFLDAHAATIPINRNVAGMPAGAPGTNGTTGLRVLNVGNRALPQSVVEP